MTEPEIPRRIILENGTEVWSYPEEMPWPKHEAPIIADIMAINRAMTPSPGYRWWTGPCICSLCGHETTVVMEIEEGLEEPVVPLECGGCGNQSMGPKEEEDG